MPKWHSGHSKRSCFQVKAFLRASGMHVTRHRDKSRAEIKALLQRTFIRVSPMQAGRIPAILLHQTGVERIVANAGVGGWPGLSRRHTGVPHSSGACPERSRRVLGAGVGLSLEPSLPPAFKKTCGPTRHSSGRRTRARRMFACMPWGLRRYRLRRMLLKARILSNCRGIFAIYFRCSSTIPIQQALESGGRHVRGRPKAAYRRS
jgi:hypothetical protein